MVVSLCGFVTVWLCHCVNVSLRDCVTVSQKVLFYQFSRGTNRHTLPHVSYGSVMHNPEISNLCVFCCVVL